MTQSLVVAPEQSFVTFPDKLGIHRQSRQLTEEGIFVFQVPELSEAGGFL